MGSRGEDLVLDSFLLKGLCVFLMEIGSPSALCLGSHCTLQAVSSRKGRE
jgi:hypothetical protein